MTHDDLLEWTRRLSAWLAETDLQELELRGPDMVVRLRRRSSGVEAVTPGAARPAAGAAQTTGVSSAVGATGAPAPAGTTTAVRATSVGVLLHRHPQRGADLAPVGSRVQAGQPVALLRIGTLLLPVTAPRDGTVARRLADDGAAVGYGDGLIELSE